MNRNLTPIVLLIVAIGIYFTFTRVKIDELKEIKEVNAQYQQAIDNSEELVKKRDAVAAAYNQINIEDRERLEKLLPDNMDNVRLIIDVNGVAARHGLSIRDVKTDAEDPPQSADMIVDPSVSSSVPSFNTMVLSFTVKSNYQSFVNFMKDLEASLRIMDISSIELMVGETGIYDYKVEVKTYWLRK